MLTPKGLDAMRVAARIPGNPAQLFIRIEMRDEHQDMQAFNPQLLLLNPAALGQFLEELRHRLLAVVAAGLTPEERAKAMASAEGPRQA